MKFSAVVKQHTGGTEHAVGRIEDGIPAKSSVLPAARRVEIIEQDGGFYLYRYGEAGEFAGDTWHCSVAEAQSQAEFEFNIRPTEWAKLE